MDAKERDAFRPITWADIGSGGHGCLICGALVIDTTLHRRYHGLPPVTAAPAAEPE